MYPLGGLVQDLGSLHLSTADGPSGASDSALRPAGQQLPGAGVWGPVRVGAVTPSFVELDGNAGAEGGKVEVEVRVVSVTKAGAPRSHGSSRAAKAGGRS